MSALREWRLRRTAYQVARAELAERGICAVVDSMSALNRYAKTLGHDSLRQDEIYRLKAALIRELYRVALCRVVPVVQRLKCYSCGGSGTWECWRTGYRERCWKCRGSGTYREWPLLEFRFQVAAREVVWHQPEAVVSGWRHEIVVADDTPREYEARAIDWHASRLDDLSFHAACDVVALHLDACGLPLGAWRPRPTLGAALLADARSRAGHLSDRLRRAWRTHVAPLPPLDDQELPF